MLSWTPLNEADVLNNNTRTRTRQAATRQVLGRAIAALLAAILPVPELLTP